MVLLDEEDLYDPLTYKTITVDTTITQPGGIRHPAEHEL